LETSGANEIPFINSTPTQLKKCLIDLIDDGIDQLLDRGYKSRIWMEKNWHPEQIAQEYVGVYEESLKG
jgi:hypothetical protein